MKVKIIIIIIVIIAILLGGVVILASILGKPLEISPNKQLDGVNKEIQDVLYYASLAPNSHNAQSWQVKLYPDKNELYIKLDENRLLKVVDAKDREAYISIGCYIANLQSALKAYGYNSDLNIFESPDSNGNVAKVTYLKTGNSIDSNALDVLKKRHTDKRVFTDKKLSESVINELTTKNSFCYPIGSENFTYLQRGTIDAVTLQSADQNYRDELAEWMRFSDKEVLKTQDGISAEQIGLKGIVKTFYYWTTNRDSAKKDKFAQQGIDAAEKQAKNCTAFLVITGENSISEWIKAGKFTEETWMKCVQAGISVQPMSSMMEVSPFSDNVQKDLGTINPVQMILRIGYTDDYGKNSQIRRDLYDYVIVIK